MKRKLLSAFQSGDESQIKEVLIESNTPLSEHLQIFLIQKGCPDLIHVYGLPLCSMALDYLLAEYENADKANDLEKTANLSELFSAVIQHTPLTREQCSKVVKYPQLSLQYIVWLRVHTNLTN
jgi:hypothetical protein